MDCLESLDLAEQYEPALGVIHKYHKQMSQTDKLNLLDYFLKRALDKLGRSYMEYEVTQRVYIETEESKAEMDSISVSEIGFNELNSSTVIQELDELNNEMLKSEGFRPDMTQ